MRRAIISKRLELQGIRDLQDPLVQATQHKSFSSIEKITDRVHSVRDPSTNGETGSANETDDHLND